MNQMRPRALKATTTPTPTPTIKHPRSAPVTPLSLVGSECGPACAGAMEQGPTDKFVTCNWCGRATSQFVALRGMDVIVRCAGRTVEGCIEGSNPLHAVRQNWGMLSAMVAACNPPLPTHHFQHIDVSIIVDGEDLLVSLREVTKIGEEIAVELFEVA